MGQRTHRSFRFPLDIRLSGSKTIPSILDLTEWFYKTFQGHLLVLIIVFRLVAFFLGIFSQPCIVLPRRFHQNFQAVVVFAALIINGLTIIGSI